MEWWGLGICSDRRSGTVTERITNTPILVNSGVRGHQTREREREIETARLAARNGSTKTYWLAWVAVGFCFVHTVEKRTDEEEIRSWIN